MAELDRAVRNAVARALTSPAAYLAQGPADDRTEAMAARAEAERLRSLLVELAEAFGLPARSAVSSSLRHPSPLNAHVAKVEPLAEASYQSTESWRGKSAAELLSLWDSGRLDLMEKRALIVSPVPVRAARASQLRQALRSVAAPTSHRCQGPARRAAHQPQACRLDARSASNHREKS